MNNHESLGKIKKTGWAGGATSPDWLQRLSRHKHNSKGGWSWRDGSEWPQREKAAIKWQTGDPADQKKNRGAVIEYRAGQQKHGGAAIRDRAGLKIKCGPAIDRSRRPKEKFAARQSRITPASSKIAAGHRTGLLKICSGLATISKGGDGRRRRPHNNQLRRGWPEETANPNQTWSTT
jgi:hypothetical protein